MKPFDLEAALAGAPVVTRDGREVTQVTLFSDALVDNFVAVVSGNIHIFPVRGRFALDDTNRLDLFMAEPVDPYAEIKSATQDPTKQTRCKYIHGEWCKWKDAGYEWRFSSPPDHYQIRDKPKTKTKVVLEAWFTGCTVLHYVVGHSTLPGWERMPNLDLVGEIEE